MVTEGERTEPGYFDGLARAIRATGVRVVNAKVIGTGRDPETVVRQALTHRAYRDDFDAYWCVVDVDSHNTLSKALDLAAREQIAVAVSNPCFEIWLLWHYVDHTAHIRPDGLRKALRKHRFADKALPGDFPFERYQAAVDRAVRAAPESSAGSRGPNPSSSVAALVMLMVEGI
nr:RloB family protein [Parafrankia sp. EUN1f]